MGTSPGSHMLVVPLGVLKRRSFTIDRNMLFQSVAFAFHLDMWYDRRGIQRERNMVKKRRFRGNYTYSPDCTFLEANRWRALKQIRGISRARRAFHVQAGVGGRLSGAYKMADLRSGQLRWPAMVTCRCSPLLPNWQPPEAPPSLAVPTMQGPFSAAPRAMP